jgi:sarcosine oxidase
MNKRKHTIVIGLGAMGSSALYQLARRGRRVLGIEQFDIPHEKGSSHGLTRIIRLAYYEHPSYVPLLVRAYELWHELEQYTGQTLLHETGSIDASYAGNFVFEGSRKSCELYGLAHEVLDSDALRNRFPAYNLAKNAMAVYQPQGGYLCPERCITAYVDAAKSHGAEVHSRERVIAWEPSADGVSIVTDQDEYECERLICSAGPWIPSLVGKLRGIAVPERQVVAWFEPRRPELFARNQFPVFNLFADEGRFYGFPIADTSGFKIGKYHHREQVIDPDQTSRDCTAEDERLLRGCVERYFPDANGQTLRMQACIFTNSPDSHFILDILPEYPQVIVASPCSGHGFKFASVIGEILADLSERGDTIHDISLHRLKRLLDPRSTQTDKALRG